MYDGENRPLSIMLLLPIKNNKPFTILWLCIVSYELKQVSGDEKIKPVFVGVISLLTLGVYTVFWSYKYGKYLLDVQKKKGMQPRDYSFLCAVLSGVFLFPVAMMIMQKQLNELWKIGK